ncbi:Mu-like prophage protein gp46 [Pseudomonas flavescens]|uniref:Mu-like prophage protein gp46 n=1 Tax=Phytopseudomonas flavescens TaxID=29435 RepID=A0A1G8FGZ1_9GAMM|nr:phage GP46 family protein [Pseudomonas flavescens]SDH81342.1 Mu-like prophage protein gp46 [Pseudomonas flavescens]
MDAGISPLSGDLTGERISSLQNAVYLRLMIPLGSYWADPDLGSLLYTLRREKDRARVSRLAVQYTRDALQGLLDDGRALSVEVTAEQPHNGRLLLLIEVADAGGRTQTFKHHVQVI